MALHPARATPKPNLNTHAVTNEVSRLPTPYIHPPPIVPLPRHVTPVVKPLVALADRPDETMERYLPSRVASSCPFPSREEVPVSGS